MDTPQTSPFAAQMRPSTPPSSSHESGSLRIAENYPFVLRHHPASWRVSSRLERPIWIPDVGAVVIAPGCNGIHTLKLGDKPEFAWQDAQYQGEKDGWRYFNRTANIPADCLPAGVPAGGYFREFPCWSPQTRLPGTYYLEVWKIPVPSLPNEDQQFTYDLAAHERWCRWLVLSGHVKEILPQVVQRQRKALITRVERAETKVRAGKQGKEYLELREAALEAHDVALQPDELRAEAAAAEAAAAETAKPKRGK